MNPDARSFADQHGDVARPHEELLLDLFPVHNIHTDRFVLHAPARPRRLHDDLGLFFPVGVGNWPRIGRRRPCSPQELQEEDVVRRSLRSRKRLQCQPLFDQTYDHGAPHRACSNYRVKAKITFA